MFRFSHTITKEKLRFYFSEAFLPIFLIIIFVIENQLFNIWLGVVPHIYWVRGTVAMLALGLLLYGPALLIRSKWRYAYLGLTSLLASLILLTEFLYFKYADGFLQFSALSAFHEGVTVLGTAVRILNWQALFFLLPFAIVAVAWMSSGRRQREFPALSTRGKIFCVILILLGVFGGYGYLLAAEQKQWGDTTRLYKNLYDLDSLVGKIGIVNFFLEDAVMTAQRPTVTQQEKQAVIDWAKARKVEAKPTGFDVGLAKGRNLIFIQVESLENAVINTTLDDQEITPNLNALAQEGIYFSNYFTQVGQGNTADAENTVAAINLIFMFYPNKKLLPGKQ